MVAFWDLPTVSTNASGGAYSGTPHLYFRYFSIYSNYDTDSNVVNQVVTITAIFSETMAATHSSMGGDDTYRELVPSIDGTLLQELLPLEIIQPLSVEQTLSVTLM